MGLLVLRTHETDPAVVAEEDLPAPGSLPRYLDLGYYAANDGVPFTQSSNLLSALLAALKRYETAQPFAETAELARWLRPRLRELGFRILAPDDQSSPAVITLVLPEGLRSQQVGDELQTAGLWLSYQSEYLRQRNWVQICLMGDCTRSHLVSLLTELRAFAPSAASATVPTASAGRGRPAGS